MLLQANVNKLFRNLQFNHVKCNFLNGLWSKSQSLWKSSKTKLFLTRYISQNYGKCPTGNNHSFEILDTTVLSVAVNKLKNKISQVFSQVVLHRVFLTSFFTGCDHVKNALFTGFEILDPVKKPVKFQNKILFHRFFHSFYLTGII